jgi:NADH-quinone oxidoreductase subunit I
MKSLIKYIAGILNGIYSLVSGMAVTIRELFVKKITEQYPENRATLHIPERFRGELTMPHDENNEHACTACGICQTNCPNGTIEIISKMIEPTEEGGKPKKVLDKYVYDLGKCTFCNLCVISCPSNAIQFTNTFENSLFTREKLILQLNRKDSKLRDKKIKQ